MDHRRHPIGRNRPWHAVLVDVELREHWARGVLVVVLRMSMRAIMLMWWVYRILRLVEVVLSIAIIIVVGEGTISLQRRMPSYYYQQTPPAAATTTL